jgi:hypothetical protein
MSSFALRTASRVMARRAAALASLALVGACGELTDNSTPTPNRYGAVNIRARATSNTAARASATVIFFEAITIAVPNSTLQQTDNCIFTGVDTLPQVARGQFRAGESVALTASGNTITMPYTDAQQRYATPDASPLTYNSGDVAQVSVPGNGTVFPAQNISVKLAEPMLPQALTLPQPGLPMPVRWNATNDPSAAVIIQLKYADPTSSSFANRQVYCEVKDDGSFDIPANGLTSFLISPANLRSITLTRWRTNEVLPDAKTVMHIVSSVDTVVALP